MITSVFSKSNPVNYVVVSLTVVVFFVINEWQLHTLQTSAFSFLSSLSKIFMLIAYLFLANFICKRNNLTKDNAYVFLYLGFFLILIPQCLSDLRLIAANFFVMLAFRRILSLKSMTATKEKIFDASLWIFVASLFHFWCILFIILVFVAIFFHVVNDFRSWFLPVLAFLSVAILFAAFCLITEQPYFENIYSQIEFQFSFRYFTSKVESAVMVLFVLFSISTLVYYLIGINKKPASAQNNIFKVIVTWFIALSILIISPQKSNALLVFALLPTSVFVSDFLENSPSNWFKEFVSWVFVSTAVVLFVFN
jgi:hypothetical protein